MWHTGTVVLCLHTGVKKLVTFLLVFLESLLFHYFIIDIKKNRISLHYNGPISILLPWK